MNNTALSPGARRTTNALDLKLHPDAGEPGAAPTGSRAIGRSFGLAIGVWEMGVGTADDVEADEVFVVLTGTATVHIHPANGFPASQLALAPGTVCRLSRGMRTTWTVHTTLRKVYLVPAGTQEGGPQEGTA